MKSNVKVAPEEIASPSKVKDVKEVQDDLVTPANVRENVTMPET